MNDDPGTIAVRLVESESVTGVWELAERRLAAGDAAFVADLGVALWQQYGSDPSPPWQYGSAFDRILRLLALTPGMIEPAVRLISITMDRRLTRYAASLLASAHPAVELERVFDGVASDELRVCVLQELLLRGTDVHHRWVTSPHWRFHPLAWLPRSLTPLEGRPSLPSYTVSGGSQDLPHVTVEPARGHGRVPAAQETTTLAETTAIGSAVKNWTDESNGRFEARTFALDADVHPDAVADTLLSLDLECLQELKGGLGPCSATQAWQQLFWGCPALTDRSGVVVRLPSR
jgi:hypothetical protein